MKTKKTRTIYVTLPEPFEQDVDRLVNEVKIPKPELIRTLVVIGLMETKENSSSQKEGALLLSLVHSLIQMTPEKLRETVSGMEEVIANREKEG